MDRDHIQTGLSKVRINKKLEAKNTCPLYLEMHTIVVGYTHHMYVDDSRSKSQS